MHTRTYTTTTMPVSEAAYREVRARLVAAGRGRQIHVQALDHEFLDMHGIALKHDPAGMNVYDAIRCGECGLVVDCLDHEPPPDACPNCGAKPIGAMSE